MKDLFYTKSDKRLFYIAGYTDNSYCVRTIIGTLNSCMKYFLKHIRFPDETTVKTEYITKSSRYKNMRYFWIDNVEVDKVPKEAFQINEDWDMFKWIQN